MIKLLIGLLFFFNASSLVAQSFIKNVNVVDVINHKMLKGYDVLSLNGKIVSVSKGRKYKLPGAVQVIEGRGKFLMPGLTDAHVHFFQSGGIYARPDAIDLRRFRPYAQEISWTHRHMEDLLRRYLSIGVTAVIDVGSTVNFLRQRDSFVNKTYSPRIFMTGPLLTTWLPDEFKNLGDDGPFVELTGEQQARQAVRDQLPFHPDFIKIWYIVEDPDLERGARAKFDLIKAAINEAHQQRLAIAVHATEQITARLAVEAGADYLVHSVENEVIADELLSLMKQKNVVICPTLLVGGNYDKVFTGAYKFTKEELKTAHPVPVRTIREFPAPDTIQGRRMIDLFSQPKFGERQRHTDSIMRLNLVRLGKAGVAIATGTDAGNIGTQHAGSYYPELEAMARSGLNLWQLLRASTIDAFASIHQENAGGSITEGKFADMILLDANPTTDLANWRKISKVIRGGTAIDPALIVKDKSDELPIR